MMVTKISDYNIARITSKETHLVRHPVLRKDKPITTCIFEGDDDETTIHLGLFIKKELVSVCSFFKNNHASILEENQYQLRGMAVLDKYQGKGVGKVILSYGENIIKNKNTKIIWCNAREIAVPFYDKSGYKIIGNPFDIKGIGKHFVMYKTLDEL